MKNVVTAGYFRLILKLYIFFFLQQGVILLREGFTVSTSHSVSYTLAILAHAFWIAFARNIDFQRRNLGHKKKVVVLRVTKHKFNAADLNQFFQYLTVQTDVSIALIWVVC